jgi:hypothetical protein
MIYLWARMPHSCALKPTHAFITLIKNDVSRMIFSWCSFLEKLCCLHKLPVTYHVQFFFHANSSTTLFLVPLQPPLLPPMVGFVSLQTTMLMLPSYVGNPFICLRQHSRSTWSTIYPLCPRYQCYHKNNKIWTHFLFHAKVFDYSIYLPSPPINTMPLV